MSAQFVVGIDLGTTNCVIAYAPVISEEPQIELLRISQLTAPGTLESRTTLPSFTYLAGEHEFCPKCDEELGLAGSPQQTCCEEPRVGTSLAMSR